MHFKIPLIRMNRFFQGQGCPKVFLFLSIIIILRLGVTSSTSNPDSFCTIYYLESEDYSGLELHSGNATNINTTRISPGIYCRGLLEPLTRTSLLLKLNETNQSEFNVGEIRWIKIEKSVLHSQNLSEFDHFPRLEKLSLFQNNLTTILGLPPSSLRALNLSNNQISELPERLFANLPGLEDVDLSHNRLHSLPDSISNLHNLRRFNAFGCKFTCQSIIGKFWEFWRMHLEKYPNFLANDDSTFCYTEEAMISPYTLLGALKAKNHKERACDESRVKDFGCNCTISSFHNNFPKEYPSSHEGRYGRLSISLKVDCNSLDLEEIPQVPALTLELNMSHNRLTDLSIIRSDPNFRNLKILDVSHNDLSSSSLYSLENSTFLGQVLNLNLKYNNIEELPRKFLTSIANTDGYGKTHLGGNKIRCDCTTIRESRPILINHKKEFLDIEEVLCRNLNDIKLLELPYQEVCSADDPLNQSEFWWYIGIGLEMGLIIIIVLKLWHDQREFRRTGVLPWCSARMPRLPCDAMLESIKGDLTRKDSLASHHFSATGVNALSTTASSSDASSKRDSVFVEEEAEKRSFIVRFSNLRKH